MFDLRDFRFEDDKILLEGIAGYVAEDDITYLIDAVSVFDRRMEENGSGIDGSIKRFLIGAKVAEYISANIESPQEIEAERKAGDMKFDPEIDWKSREITYRTLNRFLSHVVGRSGGGMKYIARVNQSLKLFGEYMEAYRKNHITE